MSIGRFVKFLDMLLKSKSEAISREAGLDGLSLDWRV